jgi:hypothetical protein
MLRLIFILTLFLIPACEKQEKEKRMYIDMAALEKLLDENDDKFYSFDVVETDTTKEFYLELDGNQEEVCSRRA